MLATLDVICGGRLIVGAGVGWMAEEFAALNASIDDRGAVTDNHILLMRSLWAGSGPSAEEGANSAAAGVVISPPPMQKPHPPIWTGGISAPALRRAANLGDGWHGVRQSPADVARVISGISQLRSRSGLSMEGYEISLRAGLDIITQPFAGDGRTPLRGSADQISADLLDYANAGLTYLVLEPRAESPEQFLEQLERFAKISKGE